MKMRIFLPWALLGSLAPLPYVPGIALAGDNAAPESPSPYPFSSLGVGAQRLEERIPPPASAKRVVLPAGSFGNWLRNLPLLPKETPVHLHDGTQKPRQDVHFAVVDLDVGKRNLQQCADAVMRLRAEYLYATGKTNQIRFHPDPGKARTLAYTGPSKGEAGRAQLARYLLRVFSEAGTASLAAELAPVVLSKDEIAAGDVLIQGGYPGHALLVLDMAEGPSGKRYLLLGQSYMPAQQFHVVKNFEDPALSPWFDAATIRTPQGLKTPEWRPFTEKDVRRF